MSATAFRMPTLGADMEEGTLLEWLVRPGDTVHRGQVVAVIDTAKSAIDIESWSDAVVRQLLVTPGTTVAVGTPLAVFEADEPTAATAAVAPTTAAAGAAAAAATATAPAATAGGAGSAAADPAGPAGRPSPVLRHLAAQLGVDLDRVVGTGRDGSITHADVRAAADRSADGAVEGSGGAAVEGSAPGVPASRGPVTGVPRQAARARVSPFARRLAARLGVDLAGLTGTGPDGAVTAADVEAAAEAAAGTATAEGTVGTATEGTAEPGPAGPTDAERAAAMRAAIGALMARSKREIPHYYLAHTVDLHAATTWVTGHNARLPVAERVLPAAVLLRATAMAVAHAPEVNGFWQEGRFRPSSEVHLGVAVNLRGGGLVTPTLRGADGLGVDALMAALHDLVQRARTGHLRHGELQEATLTVTSLGERGVELVHGVVVPPQVGLVGFGTVVRRPWAVDDMLAVRPVVTVTFAGDHRAGDGHLGARFLARIGELLQRPEELA